MRIGMKEVLLLTGGLALSGCQSSAGPNQSGAVRFTPPNTSFAAALNIVGPVLPEEAKAIAAEAAGGTATGNVTQEKEKNEVLYEVRVETANGLMEVEVRQSDGAVLEIEPDDGTN